MAVNVQLNTPLADALNSVVQPKLVEVGWSTGGGDDSALAEYVILMLVNGKTQDQIAAELSNDLLSLGPDDTDAVEFSKWLFEQVETLNRQLNGPQGGGGVGTDGAGGEQQPAPLQHDQQQAIPSMADQNQTSDSMDKADTDMGEAGAMPGDGVPTGPKNMRNQQQGGRGRLLGQISKAMDRSDDSVLHRVRDRQGTGRINTHNRQQTPRGPRGFQNRNGRGVQGRQMGMNIVGRGAGGPMANPMQNGPGMPNNMAPMSPQQQMQMMQMFEEQARMMSQFMPNFVPPAINPAFQNNGNPPMPGQQGRSLFERAEQGPPHQKKHNFGQGPRQQQDTKMDVEMGMDKGGDSGMGAHGQDPSSQTQPQGEPSETVCRFNLRCTNKDCPYAHQSPAAPDGTSVDVSDVCAFGAACKNRKCAGRHPSPAQKAVHQSEELCRFFPNCANPHCHFKHPDMPLCRNGADCSVTGCKFTHLQTPCKFHPCLNRACPYKHAEGQRGAFGDKVWVAPNAEKPHVSERKFTSDENGEEELIKPGMSGGGEDSTTAGEHQIIT